MPLHGQPEGERGVFDGFDQAIGGVGGGDQAMADFGDALVVAGVGGEFFELEGVGEVGVRGGW